jgi:hypothetical protein
MTSQSNSHSRITFKKLLGTPLETFEETLPAAGVTRIHFTDIVRQNSGSEDSQFVQDRSDIGHSYIVSLNAFQCLREMEIIEYLIFTLLKTCSLTVSKKAYGTWPGHNVMLIIISTNYRTRATA